MFFGFRRGRVGANNYWLWSKYLVSFGTALIFHLLQQPNMKYLPLNAELFVTNRRRFIERMAPKSIAIFNSNDELPTNADQLYKFKQNSDLFWLTGIEQEDSMLVLFPDNPDPKFREVLVLVKPNQMLKCDRMRLKEFRYHHLYKDLELFRCADVSTH